MQRIEFESSRKNCRIEIIAFSLANTLTILSDLIKLYEHAHLFIRKKMGYTQGYVVN